MLEQFTQCGTASDGLGGPVSNGSASPPIISLKPSWQETKKLERSGFGRHHWFAVVPTPRTARWLFPLPVGRATTESFKLYAPYKRRAKILRSLILALARTRWSGWARHKVLISSIGRLPLETLVREVTGEEQPVFAMSLGTDGEYRKLTLQVMRPEGEILGYIKLPLTARACQRVRHETAVLKHLASLPAMCSLVPKVLFSGIWGTSQILFQSPGPFEPGPSEFGSVYDKFLRQLWRLGSIKPAALIWEEVGAQWRKTEDSLDQEWRGLGHAALRQAARDLANASIACGLIHGDFAPWNCRLGNGQLFVFDWESAMWSAPSLWDVFHFRLQVAGLLKEGEELLFLPKRSVERASFLLFLLNSVCQTIDEKCSRSQDFLTYKRNTLRREVARD